MHQGKASFYYQVTMKFRKIELLQPIKAKGCYTQNCMVISHLCKALYFTDWLQVGFASEN